MSVLIDTTVWSIALRRNVAHLNPRERVVRDVWEQLIDEGDAVIIGAIRQEVLSGIRSPEQFRKLQLRLDTLEILAVQTHTYDQAAMFYNALQAKGIAGGYVDQLICAAAYEHQVPIFSTDPDFTRYARHLPIGLYTP